MEIFVLAILALTNLAAAFAAPSLEEGCQHLYNLEFEDARRRFQDFAREHSDDPVAPGSHAAAYLFNEIERLHILQSEFFTHDQHFATDHKLSPDLFAGVLSSGIHSDYLIEKRHAPALREMKTSRMLAAKFLARNPDYADAWVAIGVENYMLSIKAAPVRFFLRFPGAEADRNKGLEKLRIASEKGRYLAPFARLMLAVAALRENNPSRAMQMPEGLVRDYPCNPLYAQELARLQLAVGNS